ncbi:hypothetical protein D9M72_550480 [compost metagenome]
MKNVRRALRVKIASHVASVKNAFVNCASLWMPLRLLRPPLLPLRLLPLKNAQLVSHVKNARHAHRVKNVSHVPNKLPQPQLKKN